jgi:hypothetical protein
MEIHAARGVEGIHIGEERSTVERLLGPPLGASSRARAVYATNRSSIFTYTDTNTVELLEATPSDLGAEQVSYGGIQLTFGIMEEVVAELRARGFTTTSSAHGEC